MDKDLELEQGATAEVATEAVEVPTEPESLEDALWSDDKVEGEQPAAETEDDAGESAPEAEKTPEEPEDEYAAPEGLSEKANVRFQKLANENKQYKSFGSVDQLQNMQADAQTLDTFRGRIADCGMQPTELDAVFEYTKAVKSGNWQTVERYLQDQLYQFQVLTGKRLNVDPLQAFPDLRGDVDDMTMSEQHALEIARARTLGNMQNQQQQAQAQQQQMLQQQQAQEQQVTDAALQQIEQLTLGWMASDVLWAERQPLLKNYLEKTLGNQPPHTWAAGLQAYYDALSTQSVNRTRSPNALRPNAMGAQSAGKEPASMADALWS